MTQVLHSHRLPALPAGLAWRMQGPADLGQVESVHRRAVEGVPPVVVKHFTRAFLHGFLAGRGVVPGIETSGGELVGFGLLQHDLLPDDDPRPHLGLSQRPPLAKLAGAAVLPEKQGEGLQRLLIRARIALAEPGKLLFSTASPVNPASWKSLLSEGFLIRHFEYPYGGLPRFVLVRLPLADNADIALEYQDIASEDIPAHERALRDGWVGVASSGRPALVRYQRARVTP